MLTLRLNVVSLEFYANGLPVAELAEEIWTLARSLDGEKLTIKPEPHAFPLLASMNTFGTYRLVNKTNNPVMSLVDHGGSTRLPSRLRKKRTKAAGYPPACRPLWLLLDVEIHFGFGDFTDASRTVTAETNPTEYRVIVQQTYFPPLVINFCGSARINGDALITLSPPYVSVAQRLLFRARICDVSHASRRHGTKDSLL